MNQKLVALFFCISAFGFSANGYSASQGIQSAASEANNKCIDVVAQATNDGAPVHLWDCGTWPSQNFLMQSDGTIRAYGGNAAASAGAPLCLDIDGATAANDTQVHLRRCVGGTSQTWAYDSNSQQLHGTGSLGGFCLDYDTRSSGGSVLNGTPLHLWSCLSVQSQKWSLASAPSPSPTPTSSPLTAGIKSASSGAANKCMDVVYQATNDGASVHLWDCGNWPSQNFVQMSDGTIRAYGGNNAASAGAPLCLDIDGAAAADGTQIHLRRCSGGASQAWGYDSSSQHLHGTGALSNYCLDYDTRQTGGQVQNGTPFHMWTCYAGLQSQQWVMGASSSTPPTSGSLSMKVLPYKARFAPGESPGFTVTVYNAGSSTVTGAIRLRQTSAVKPGFEHVDYRSTSIAPNSSRNEEMYWVGAPSDDFTGYFVEASFIPDGASTAAASAVSAVDISSTWTRYPRYGYLSEFFAGQSTARSQQIIDTLAGEFHINGLQYYDWQFRHESPLPPSGATQWLDWRGQENWWGPSGPQVSEGVLSDLINQAHARNVASMPYFAIYGAMNGYDKYGVSWTWGLFNSSKNQFSVSGGNTTFYMMNPLDTGWQSLIIPRFEEALSKLNWDGLHLDTYGDLGGGNYYNYQGQKLDLSNGFFSPMLNRIRASTPQNKSVVFNVVDGNYGTLGSEEVANPNTGVSLFYTELWGNGSYNGVADYVNYIRNKSGKSMVLAAYMNRDDGGSLFDSNSVKLADAAFFSSGAFHIELGDAINSPDLPSMLPSEYFPSNSKSFPVGLRDSMKAYYDFAVAYENLLFDPANQRLAHDTSGIWVQDIPLSGTGEGYKVWFQRFRHSKFDVLHFINLQNDNDQWRHKRNAPSPVSGKEVNYYVPAGANISHCYLASPDLNGGAPQDLGCQTLTNQYGTYVKFVIPSLAYWDMVYIDRQGQF